jgi:hypothetical protein
MKFLFHAFQVECHTWQTLQACSASSHQWRKHLLQLFIIIVVCSVQQLQRASFRHIFGVQLIQHAIKSQILRELETAEQDKLLCVVHTDPFGGSSRKQEAAISRVCQGCECLASRRVADGAAISCEPASPNIPSPLQATAASIPHSHIHKHFGRSQTHWHH